jgi:hypothetical protein
VRRFDRRWLMAGGNHSASGEKSESERICRTLGSFCQAGVPFKVDPVRRRSALADYGRKKSPGQGQQTAFPDADDKPKKRGHAVACRHRLGGILK